MERTITKIWKRIERGDKLAFLYGFIANLIFNFYVYTNGIFAHDGVTLSESSSLTGFGNGRPLAVIIAKIFNGAYASPWLVGFWASVFIGFAVVFLSRILKLKHEVWKILLALFTVGNYAFFFTQIYVSTLPAYAAAIFFSAIGVWFCIKRTWGSILVGGTFIVAGLCCYQAYISLVLLLFVIGIIGKIQRREESTKKILLIGLAYIGIAASTMIIYYGIWQAGAIVSGSGILDYRGYGEVTSSISFGGLFEAWLFGIASYFANPYYDGVARIVFALITLLGIAATYVSYLSSKDKKPSGILLLTFAVLCLPLASTFIYVLNPIDLPPRMSYGVVAPCFLLLASVSRSVPIKKMKARTVLSWITVFLSAIFIIMQLASANAFYLQMDISQRSTYAFASRFVDRVEQIDGVSQDTKIVLVYDAEKSLYPQAKWSEELYSVGNMTVEVCYLPYFIKNNMNSEMNISYDWDDEYAGDEEVNALECYPKEDCYVWKDGVLIIKLPLISDKANLPVS